MKNSAREHYTDKDFGPLFSGELLRDEGISKVLEHNEPWTEICIEEIGPYLQFHDSFTGEDIRFYLVARAGHPKSPNAWGALINTLVRRKIIKPTGEWRKMRDESSHCRRTPVYTK